MDLKISLSFETLWRHSLRVHCKEFSWENTTRYLLMNYWMCFDVVFLLAFNYCGYHVLCLCGRGIFSLSSLIEHAFSPIFTLFFSCEMSFGDCEAVYTLRGNVALILQPIFHFENVQKFCENQERPNTIRTRAECWNEITGAIRKTQKRTNSIVCWTKTAKKKTCEVTILTVHYKFSIQFSPPL